MHGFYAYLFCPQPDPSVDCERFRQRLDSALIATQTSPNFSQAVIGVELVHKKPLTGYSAKESEPFFKITVASPKLVATCRTVLERGIACLPGDRVWCCGTTFESNVPFPLRFMIDEGMSGGSWVEIPDGTYTVRKGNEITSTCQLEIDVHFSSIKSHKPEGEWQRLAPLRILSFDIECVNESGKGFPTPEIAKVIQIAAVLKNILSPDNICKVVWTLDTCADIPGATVLEFSSEVELLHSFQRFIIESDADILTGYNIVNFDLPFLIERSIVIKANSFPKLGRLQDSISKIKSAVFESKALGKRESKDINIDGRVQFDMLTVIQREYKLRSYSLNSVAAHFLNEQKEDVHYSIIGDLQRGNEETRKRLAVYCLKDAVLPLRLLEKLLCMYNYIEMARVTGVPIPYLLTRGQMIKVASQLFRLARANNYLVPTNRGGGGNNGEDGVAFEGATVLEPTTGFYTDPIATLDFASLYPSIIIAHNLCYSTILTPHQASQLDPNSVTRTPCGNFFAKAALRPGLLPLILQDLLSARKRARKELAGATDPMVKMVLNGRQLALKISANSVYGFTGATVGMLPCLEISSSVTAFGREMIDQTKSLVEAKFNRANGFEHDAVVVYGDTDSVFVKFGCDTVAESMRLGQMAADEISQSFIAPIKLEFEKVYHPYLLMAKKRYAGLYWSKPETFDKLDAKGIETVRRDNCELVKVVIERVLDIVLKEMSIDKAVKFVQNTIADLLQNKVDLSMLVISKSLAKGADSEAYAAKQAHVELAEKMRQRDPANAPAVGDRVQYVLVKAAKGMKAYEKAEDPLYVLENNLSIDGYHYIEHQLKQPLMRIFENVLPNAESVLFAGEHTRKVSNMAPTTGALAGFVTKSLKCLSCKVVMKHGALCDHCKKNGREKTVVLEKINELREYEIAFNRLWSQCQRCQGSLCQDVICTSRDCPIFYRRAKVRKDAASAMDNVRRLQAAADW